MELDIVINFNVRSGGTILLRPGPRRGPKRRMELGFQTLPFLLCHPGRCCALLGSLKGSRLFLCCPGSWFCSLWLVVSCTIQLGVTHNGRSRIPAAVVDSLSQDQSKVMSLQGAVEKFNKKFEHIFATTRSAQPETAHGHEDQARTMCRPAFGDGDDRPVDIHETLLPSAVLDTISFDSDKESVGCK